MGLGNKDRSRDGAKLSVRERAGLRAVEQNKVERGPLQLFLSISYYKMEEKMMCSGGCAVWKFFKSYPSNIVKMLLFNKVI